MAPLCISANTSIIGAALKSPADRRTNCRTRVSGFFTLPAKCATVLLGDLDRRAVTSALAGGKRVQACLPSLTVDPGGHTCCCRNAGVTVAAPHGRDLKNNMSMFSVVPQPRVNTSEQCMRNMTAGVGHLCFVTVQLVWWFNHKCTNSQCLVIIFA